MKQLFLLSVIFSLSLSAQDTIRFRNGEVKAVKVSEVGINDIKYNRFDNVGGPVYLVNKNDVQLIKYAGGSVDSFKVEAVVVQNVPVKKAPRVTTEQSLAQNGPGKIIISDNRLYHNNKAVGEGRLLKMIIAYPDNTKQNLMLKNFKEMKEHKKKQYTFGFVGLGVGIAAPYIGFIAALVTGDGIPALAGVTIGLGAGITGAVISSINKRHRFNKKLDIVRIYNGEI